ncbi:glutathione S-transferase family protein [Humitalea sp. 24SJ18S-53]|uniref:glutathione S-transferase family protein n=1 Tax=Humitalea sp. 24SJ18S-53 TaxID=3422307 RepID=UPI003D676F42
MKLYYFDGSTTCRPIVTLAAEAGVPLDLQPVNLLTGEHMAPDYTARNPNQLVPLLEDGDFRLTEGSAILKYIAEIAGSPAYPADPRARAKVNAQMDWFNTGFYREWGYGVVYPKVMDYTAFPDANVQQAVTDRCITNAARLLGILNDHMLTDAAPYLGGMEPNLADFLGVSYVTIGEMVGFDFSRYPRVQRWIAAMKARPSWPQAHAGFEAWRDSILAQRAA